MILDTLTQSDRYIGLHPLFPRAIEFLRDTDLKSLPTGMHTVQGEQLFAIVEACQGRTREEAKLECHRKYIDIQLVLKGTDEMGWKALADCRDPVSDYSEEKDIRFFHDTPGSWISTPPGAFASFSRRMRTRHVFRGIHQRPQGDRSGKGTDTRTEGDH